MPRKDDDKRIEPFYVQTSDIRFLREESGEGSYWFAIAKIRLQAFQAYITETQYTSLLTTMSCQLQVGYWYLDTIKKR